MKNIELTEDHKSKLLEMCKVLFPEFKKIKLEKGICCGDNYFLQYDKRKIISLGNCCSGYSNNEHFEIHWFEFCMTHLSNKLLELDKSEKLDYEFQMLLQDSWWQSHPVDYSYEQFLKLK